MSRMAWTFIWKAPSRRSRHFSTISKSKHLRPRASPLSRLVPTEQSGLQDFTIRESKSTGRPSVRISPDLPVCEDCLGGIVRSNQSALPLPLHQLHQLRSALHRHREPSVRPRRTPPCSAGRWTLSARLNTAIHSIAASMRNRSPAPIVGRNIRWSPSGTRRLSAAQLLRDGRIVAIKGIGGYHLACDANNAEAVQALRERKYRKEKPFAVMVRDIDVARRLCDISPESEALLTSRRAPSFSFRRRSNFRASLRAIPNWVCSLPYAPLHHLLFAAGAPEVLVMTSANRSSEPIAYEDDDARRQLSEIADAFLIGERPIARRVDDSVARAGVFGPMILRRSRGYAPGAVARLPIERPLLAVGADLKNTSPW